MKISKRQLKRIIREEKARLLSEQHIADSIALDHLIDCYLSGKSDEECADSMPNDSF